MAIGEMYHVGVVVPDVEAGQARFSQLLGTVWGPIIESDVEVRDEDGNDRVVHTRICYSVSAPHIELIQEQPGTPWVCNEFSNLHHIGFFSDDVPADSGKLSSASCPFELGGSDGLWSYNRDALGVRIEYVTAEGREFMESFMFQPPQG
jgi:hypothetical protein